MADPVVVKVSALTELTDLATGDLIEVVDISEPDVAKKTKKLPAGSVKIFNANQIIDGIVTQSKLTNESVSLAKLATDVRAAIRNLVYMQLFPASEIITTTTGKAYFFVPSHLSGMSIKKAGIGVVTTGTSNTTVSLGSLTSIAGNGFVEGADINVALPSVGTKISVNVTAGDGSPKGLDFWFVVG